MEKVNLSDKTRILKLKIKNEMTMDYELYILKQTNYIVLTGQEKLVNKNRKDVL